MSSINTENNSELDNPLKERIKILMTVNELAHPYSFATRVGLSKGTFTGIWREGRQSLHQRTINKICAATGVDPDWLDKGIGEPFPANRINEPQANIRTEVDEPIEKPKTIQKKGLTLSTTINIDKLNEVFETTQEILDKQNRMMSATALGEFTVMLYKMFVDEKTEPFNSQLLQQTTYIVESVLENKQLRMSPKNKTLLIIAIYTLYIDYPADAEQMLQTTEALIRKIA